MKHVIFLLVCYSSFLCEPLYAAPFSEARSLKELTRLREMRRYISIKKKFETPLQKNYRLYAQRESCDEQRREVIINNAEKILVSKLDLYFTTNSDTLTADEQDYLLLLDQRNFANENVAIYCTMMLDSLMHTHIAQNFKEIEELSDTEILLYLTKKNSAENVGFHFSPNERFFLKKVEQLYKKREKLKRETTVPLNKSSSFDTSTSHGYNNFHVDTEIFECDTSSLSPNNPTPRAQTLPCLILSPSDESLLAVGPLLTSIPLPASPSCTINDLVLTDTSSDQPPSNKPRLPGRSLPHPSYDVLDVTILPTPEVSDTYLSDTFTSLPPS